MLRVEPVEPVESLFQVDMAGERDGMGLRRVVAW